jgi:UDP-N-acetylmuramyl pentapeptide phosphotransferase/UDP-N-acetylglucosamine-1-phosphate transferase
VVRRAGGRERAGAPRAARLSGFAPGWNSTPDTLALARDRPVRAQASQTFARALEGEIRLVVPCPDRTYDAAPKLVPRKALRMTEGVVAIVGASVSLAGGMIVLRLPGPAAQPVPDRWHKKRTPVTGGVALLGGVLLALAAGKALRQEPSSIAYVALGAAAAFTVGFLDDRRWIGPRTKFAGQIAVAAGIATALHPRWLPVALGIPTATLVLVAAMNSFNFLDNIDGLAAGTAGIALAAFALTTLVSNDQGLRLIGCAGAAACLGFLPLNYRRNGPAKLFMGDSGSHLLGLLIGSCALLIARSRLGGGEAALLAPLLILALPIVDTALVIAVRLGERRPIWKGGTDHISHRLVYVGLGERGAVAALLGLEAACAGLGLAVVAEKNALATGGALGLVFGLLLALCSRLTLVTEQTIDLGETGLDAGRAPVEHAALAREIRAGSALGAAVVDFEGECQEEESENPARAN